MDRRGLYDSAQDEVRRSSFVLSCKSAGKTMPTLYRRHQSEVPTPLRQRPRFIRDIYGTAKRRAFSELYKLTD